MKTIRSVWIGGLALMLGALAACAGPAASTSAPTAAPVAAATDAAPTAAPTTAPAPTAVPAVTEAAQPTDAPQPTAASPAALKVTGLVASEIGWSLAELKAMPAVTASGKNNKGEGQTYTGVLLADLLKLAGPAAGAKTVVFVGDSQLEVPLAEITACTDCIASFRSQGGFSLLLPYYSGQLALKGLTEIQVK